MNRDAANDGPSALSKVEGRSVLSRDGQPEDLDDDRLRQAMEEYLQLLERGEAPAVTEYVRRYAPIQQQLTMCLEALQFVHQATPTLGQDPFATPIKPLATLGDFRVIRELARGGMGVVYEAEQLSLGRQVALKVLPMAGLLSQRDLARFKNEARAAAMLKHPRIVSVHSVGCERGVHYYAMELIVGQSLAELIPHVFRPAGPRRPRKRHDSTPDSPSEAIADEAVTTLRLQDTLPLEENRDSSAITVLPTGLSSDRKTYYRAVARLGIQAAEALDYAHTEGVIHRDIKPSNLMLDLEGNLHITDFGLARIQSGDALTMSGDRLGTLRYMSPEQCESRDDVGPRSDIYSLGATLYELLAGVPAMPETNRAALARHIVEREPLPLLKHDVRIPRDLATIVHKCLAKSPCERYSSAKDLAEDLHRFQSHRPIHARRTNLGVQTWKWIRRNRRLSVVLAAFLGLLVILAISGPLVTLRMTHLLRVERQLMREQKQLSTTLRRQLYDASIRDAQLAVEDADFARARRLLEPYILHENQDSDLLGFETRYLWSLTQADLRRIESPPHWTGVMRVAVSPNGRFQAHGTVYGSVIVVDHPDQSPRLQQHQVHNWFILSLEFSPDSQLLFTGGPGLAKLWDVTHWTEVQSLPTQGQRVLSAAFSPDGRWLGIGLAAESLMTTAPVNVQIWERNAQSDRETHFELRHTLPGLVGGVNDLTYSCDGQLLAACSRDSAIRLWSVPGYKSIEGLQAASSHVARLKFHPHRPDLLAVATVNQQAALDVSDVCLWDIRNRKVVHHIQGETCRIWGLEFSPEGRWLATGNADGVVLLSALEPVGSSSPSVNVLEQRSYRLHAAEVTDLAFTADGENILACSYDGQVKRCALSDEGPAEFLAGHETMVMDLEFFEDNRRLASIGWSPQIRLWDTLTGRLLKEKQIGTYPMDIQILPGQQQILYAAFDWPTETRTEIGIWDLIGDQHRVLFQSSGSTSAFSVACSPDGAYVAATVGCDVVIWETATGIETQRCRVGSGDREPVMGLDWHPQRNWLATAVNGEEDARRVMIWDVTESRPIAELDCGRAALHSLRFSPDGKQLAGGGSKGSLFLWESVTPGDRTVRRDLDGHREFVWGLTFSPDARRLFTASRDGTVQAWNTETGRSLLRFRTRASWMQAVAISPDGSILAYGGGGNSPFATIHLARTRERSMPDTLKEQPNE